MTTIGDKIFSYIDTATDLTPQMVMDYKNSLIFIGDEKQIYHPLTGAYVGLGTSTYNYLKELINGSNESIGELYEYVNQNVVKSIFVDYSANEIKSHFTSLSVQAVDIAGQTITDENTYHKLMTNQDVVLKGLHNYDNENNIIKTIDELGKNISTNDDSNINKTLWKHINIEPLSKGSSGITINVHHNPGGTSIYREGTYTDKYGFQFHYTYHTGQDYITIDDSLTWSYITAQTSYLMTFSKQMAVQQANRVYHDILGGNEPVYIEKEFDEVFTTDIYSDLIQLVPGELGEVYIHVKSNNDDKGIYKKVRIYNDENTDKYYIYTQHNNDWWIIKTNDDNVPAGGIPITTDDGFGNQINVNLIQPTNLQDWLYPYDGYDTTPLGWEVTWYHIDAEATAQGQANLADGIQTLKEVTYILDKLTDGSDDNVINLTYNIAQNAIDIADLKNWQQSISNNVVTSIEASSLNDFVFLNTYSKNKWDDDIVHGDAKIDLALNLAKTYTTGSTTYAAYIYSDHSSLVATNWISLGDATNPDYWIDLYTLSTSERSNLLTNLQQILGSASTSIPTYAKQNNNQYEYTHTDIALNNNAFSNVGPGTYILFNYDKLPNIQNGEILDGITTVNWVTTYYKWAREDLVSYVISMDNDIKDWVQTYISGMNVTDTAQAGQFVTKVDQVEGKIVITRKRLPLDDIIYSSEIYGDDFFEEISTDYATELVSTSNVYAINTNTGNYEKVASIIDNQQYYLRRTIKQFTKISLTNINNSDGPKSITQDLLSNEGNVTYFLNTTDVKANTGGTITDTFKYQPVDIQELLSAESNDYLSTAILNKLYYYDDSIPTGKQKKYFSASYRQRVDGGTDINVATHVMPLGASSSTNSGLADSWDVRHTIESMFTWVNLKTNKFIE